uniref:Uncharacterized protein n=1 Tax=Setaria italica TaxID=4555 RepID=K3XRT7_SETIT
MENASKIMGSFLDGKEDLSNDFKDCLDNSCSPREFEGKWQAMLDKHGLNDDERFKHLYGLRESWVPAYFMHCFFPFLQTTAQSEGFNAALKRYANPKQSIFNFVQQYRKIQQRSFGKQDLHEAKMVAKVAHYLTGSCSTCSNMSSSYYIVRIEGDDLIDVPYKRCRELLYGTRTFRVTIARSEGAYSCTCCKF